ncbi:MAG: hypothetical protein IT342_01680 [Candidatus Melainabacteria bacterium]|nr:hypothetical protein [Candidatus Melainabacteria bacterium]
MTTLTGSIRQCAGDFATLAAIVLIGLACAGTARIAAIFQVVLVHFMASYTSTGAQTLARTDNILNPRFLRQPIGIELIRDIPIHIGK